MRVRSYMRVITLIEKSSGRGAAQVGQYLDFLGLSCSFAVDFHLGPSGFRTGIHLTSHILPGDGPNKV